MSDRILTKEKCSAYLRELVDKSVDLKLYIGSSEQELDDKLSSNAGLPGPTLSFFAYRWKLSGNNQRTFNTRTISFAVIIDGIKPDDYHGQDLAVERAEIIGLEFISRIYQDSQRPNIGWLYNNLDKDSVVGEEIRGTKDEGLYGMEFHIDIKVSEPLLVDKSKWVDGEAMCG